MSPPREPDDIQNVTVDGYQIVTYSYGSGDNTLLLHA